MRIVHIDMDAFYASVEELDNPQIKDKPVIVGGPTDKRGVVSAANYHARKFGVKSAMPMAVATRLCPQAVIIIPRHRRYVEISKQIRAIFNRYTPLVQPLSLDEAFLDLNDSVKLFGPVIEIAYQIKQEIQCELNLTASVGVAPNKFLAKLASDADKPDGFVIVEESQIQSFLDPMSVSQLWGVGKSSAQKLERNAIFTVAHLRDTNIEKLQQLFGDLQAQHLWNLSRGIDNRPVITDSAPKSISKETTFSTDLDDLDELKRTFMLLTENVCYRLRAEYLQAKTVQIKYRRKDFKTFTRSESLSNATDQTQTIWDTVNYLLNENVTKSVLPLRLIGVGLSNFESDDTAQVDLFEKNDDQLDVLADRIHQKFGNVSLLRAKGIAKKDKSHN